MIKNNTTLIVDGNWLLMSRLGVRMDQFDISLPQRTLEASRKGLVALLAQSVNTIVRFFGDDIDNVIIVSDGDSWRKHIRRCKLYRDTYKGNRVKDENLDWNYIWSALDEFKENCKECNISCFMEKDCEGDDWCWHWSRTLNKHGINAIVWSSDRDLQQLVQYCKNGSWTAWYNDKKGLVCHQDLELKEDGFFDCLESFEIYPQSLEVIIRRLKGTDIDVTYINPLDVCMEKVICGDAGDNIKSIIRIEKNGRTQRVSEKEWESVFESMGREYEDLEDFKKAAPDIISNLRKLKRFEECKDSDNDLKNMFLFNMRLVCLDSKYIPAPVKNQMKKHNKEYEQADMESISGSYTSMYPDQSVDLLYLFDVENW